MNSAVKISGSRKVENFQHHVFYVSDMETSKQFYTRLFDLQISALNHPDSSAAMRLSRQEMQFYSFGFYHHDVCLVKMWDHECDTGSVLFFSVEIDSMNAFLEVKSRAQDLATNSFREGRLLSSAANQSRLSFCLPDPDGQWIEVLGPGQLEEATDDE